ncbi:MAG: NusG domain II-containing protein [Clostridia bacterium]|nr:NusG domain II-containing protein [Clostridia bacterium]
MKHKHFIIIFIIIFIVCILSYFLASTSNTGNFAEVYSDGKLVQKINLEQVSEPYEFTIENNGSFNTVSVSNGSISVSSADCPDKLCVKQGAIRNSTYPIVCLPNKLVVKITDSTPSEEIPDAISK